MALQLEEYRTELINKLLLAVSQEETKDLIDTVISKMQRHRVNNDMLCHFAEQVISELKLFNPMKKQAQQWSNIQLAKVLFNRIKKNVQAKNN